MEVCLWPRGFMKFSQNNNRLADNILQNNNRRADNIQFCYLADDYPTSSHKQMWHRINFFSGF